MKTFLIATTLLVGAYALASVGRVLWLAQKSGRIVGVTTLYRQDPPKAEKRVLIMGDSTAVGVGARTSLDSIAGRLGQDLPNAQIENISISGMKTADLASNLPNVKEKYDLIVVHIGANDAIRLVDFNKTKENLEKIMHWASQNGKVVAHYTAGKIGEAPFFPWYIRPLYNSRALQLRDIATEVAGKFNNVHYINLIHNGRDMFAEDPDKYYAPDYLHLSSAGYELWYEQLKNTVDINKI